MTTSQQDYIETYWSCYERVKKTQGDKVQTISDGMKSLLESVESEFSCNGICDAGLFYFFKNVRDGPPTKNCMDGIKDAFKDKPLAIGIILLVSFVLTLCAWFSLYGFCCRKSKD
jgi:hypothetical protein